MDILFKNATVVTMNPAAPILTNASVGISGRKITYISSNELPANAPTPPTTPARTIDCTHKVILPGLYNCHTHAAMSLLRGFADDLALEDWLFNHVLPAEDKFTPQHIRVGTRLAMAEMLASGTVSFSDMYVRMEVVAEEVREAGMLANICNGMLAGESGLDAYSNKFHETVRAFEKNTDNRVKFDAHVHGCYTSAPEWWGQIAGFARENNLQMQVHLSETKTEHDNCVKNYGKTPAQAFADAGVFDVPTVAAHGVWVTEADMALLAKKGVSIAHNPISNLKLASGLAPVSQMEKAGINVTLGTDGMASNNSHDLFEEIKAASLLQKYITNDPTSAPAAAVLAMATTNGAKAQGRAHESGMIAQGYDADMILLDFDTPRNAVCYNPIANLAYSASGRDVCMTLCRGKVLYENGEFTTIDIEKTLHEARAITI